MNVTLIAGSTRAIASATRARQAARARRWTRAHAEPHASPASRRRRRVGPLRDRARRTSAAARRAGGEYVASAATPTISIHGLRPARPRERAAEAAADRRGRQASSRRTNVSLTIATRGAPGPIPRVEVASVDEPRAVGGEPVGRDRVDVGRVPRQPTRREEHQVGRLAAVLDLDAEVGHHAAHRRDVRERRVRDAGRAAHRVESRARTARRDAPARRRCPVASSRRRAPGSRSKPTSSVVSDVKVLHEQAGADDEHERQRHLADDERARPARSGDRRSTPRPRSRIASIGLAREARSAGARPTSKRRGKRHGRGEREQPPVDLHVEEHGVRLRRQLPDEQAAAPVRDAEAGERARGREQQDLDEQLAREAPARRAQRQAHAELVASRGGARQEQIGDVGAGDQQHERDHGHRHEHRLAIGAAHQSTCRRRPTTAGTAASRCCVAEGRTGVMRIARRLADLRLHAAKRLFRRGQRLPVLQARDDAQPADAAAIESRCSRRLISRSVAIGTATSNVRPTSMPKKPGGMTPTMVKATRSTTACAR